MHTTIKNRENQTSLRSRGNDIKDYHSDYDRLEGTFVELTTDSIHRRYVFH